MKQLSLIEDPIHFLKNIVPITGRPYSTTSTSVTFSQSFSLEPLNESLSALKMQLEEKLDSVFQQEIDKISAAAMIHFQIIQNIQYTDPELPVRRADSKGLLPPDMSDGQALIAEPVTREDFLQYSCHFTLDPNTVHRVLHLSEGNRRVEPRLGAQSYPDHPDRFDWHTQVLCREGVSARCYWEMEWSGEVNIAVSYKSISRKRERDVDDDDEDDGVLGGNDQSWCLVLNSPRSSFFHNDEKTDLPLVASSRIGVYVDHRAGTLAFYSISGDKMTLLHRVHTTFTHPLYPGFWLYEIPSSVRLL
ncbi:tripartite motif-containing protein 16-like [Engraulis encrasicolus]|uniref:tripartite motif-containing protein 16-like n=1 Tax=Engraulis encrasicolus TaxID=184585 RepID=UPI002FD6F121